MVFNLFCIIQLQLHITRRHTTIYLISPTSCGRCPVISIFLLIVCIDLISILITVETAVGIIVRERSFCSQTEREIILCISIDIGITSQIILVTGNVTTERSRIVTILMHIIDIFRIIIGIRAFDRLHLEHSQYSRIITVTTRQTYVFTLFILTANLCTYCKTVCYLSINIQLKIGTLIFKVRHHRILSGMSYRKIIVGLFRATCHIRIDVVLRYIFSHYHIIIVIALISRFGTSFPFSKFLGTI